MELHITGKSFIWGTQHSQIQICQKGRTRPNSEYAIGIIMQSFIYIIPWYQNAPSKAEIWNNKSENKPAVLHDQFSKLFQLHIYLINLKTVHYPCLNSLLYFPYKVIGRAKGSRPSPDKFSQDSYNLGTKWWWTTNLVTYVPSHFCLSSLLSKLHVQKRFCFLLFSSLFLEKWGLFRTSTIL